MQFFYKNASGLNADIKRHKEKEEELRLKISELEKDDILPKTFLNAYREFLNQLLQSKAEVTNKIGRRF